MSDFARAMEETRASEDKHRADWASSDYTGKPCVNCGRNRVCICTNGKHRCEKCLWCPELNKYIGETI